ncbi:hypothetical protein K3D86_002379 [Escherichia coli]|nr:hypothetical protein [Escherichia coli]EHW3039746.1 hypothetical protein [Escherichia coli]
MDSNISELVKSGHEIASDLKASCGAVDVRSVAKLISDLATQLEVQYVRSNALAAENAGLKASIPQQRNVEFDNDSMDDISLAEDVGFNDAIGRMKMNMSKTPATDAFLAEIRAEARKEGINYTASRLAAAFNHGFINKSLREVFDVTRMILSAKEELANEAHPIDGLSGEYAEKSLEEWAEQLRKGGNQ